MYRVTLGPETFPKQQSNNQGRRKKEGVRRLQTTKSDPSRMIRNVEVADGGMGVRDISWVSSHLKRFFCRKIQLTAQRTKVEAGYWKSWKRKYRAQVLGQALIKMKEHIFEKKTIFRVFELLFTNLRLTILIGRRRRKLIEGKRRMKETHNPTSEGLNI